ncbi:uncharacterized protein LOC110349322 [Heterocephalus glaber]|uniref:Uncharacterized protein LOC110349322 n=1 Tax=Heterocephalus glaber TaxID=10181 RepID=A0AAX6SXZ3_HETGA|nr:uncharacterized protein LOC110349322 [Heterocephalus glaber]
MARPPAISMHRARGALSAGPAPPGPAPRAHCARPAPRARPHPPDGHVSVPARGRPGARELGESRGARGSGPPRQGVGACGPARFRFRLGQRSLAAPGADAGTGGCRPPEARSARCRIPGLETGALAGGRARSCGIRVALHPAVPMQEAASAGHRDAAGGRGPVRRGHVSEAPAPARAPPKTRTPRARSASRRLRRASVAVTEQSLRRWALGPHTQVLPAAGHFPRDRDTEAQVGTVPVVQLEMGAVSPSWPLPEPGP